MRVNISCDAVGDNLYVGSFPMDPTDIQFLKEELGVTAILNLQSDEDLQVRGVQWQAVWTEYTRAGIRIDRVPMRDFDRADLLGQLGEAVDTLETRLNEGHTVYLHCNMGVNRSPTVAVAYFAARKDMGLEKATAFVQSQRRSIPYPDVVEKWLKTDETRK